MDAQTAAELAPALVVFLVIAAVVVLYLVVRGRVKEARRENPRRWE